MRERINDNDHKLMTITINNNFTTYQIQPSICGENLIFFILQMIEKGKKRKKGN